MELYHHGIRGQKWGNRRWQNPDGSRTAAGKKRYPDWPPRYTLPENIKRMKMAGRRILYSNSDKKLSEILKSTSIGKEFVEQNLKTKKINLK